jgi:hypothetical protein
LVGKGEGNITLGRHRLGWEDNIKIDLKWDWRVWAGSIWMKKSTSGWALVNMVMNFGFHTVLEIS